MKKATDSWTLLQEIYNVLTTTKVQILANLLSYRKIEESL